ncbi:hypothetical protein ACLH0B_21640 [Aeromonas salmonicida]|uniref:GAP1-N1 domain-containing protein n=1 Tax=Aeromonas salmonicida TaxID=645 RepID=UPI003CFDBE11
MKLDQCLFGYDDGHRLLSSSLPLGAEISLLTELSDLAPGTVFQQSEGYWTGLPVPSIGRYVLMRTWPAPEMSRPGCVWTHALLIEPLLLESIADLSELQRLAIRPNGPLDRGRYSEPLEVDFSHNSRLVSPTDDTTVRKLISSLYEMISTTVEVTSPGELDGSLFAVWSQQWPRLRRNFRFQTATSRVPRSIGSTRFDITAVLAHQEIKSSQQDSSEPSWVSTAVLDVQKGANGSLRPFLWRYGRDVRRQRGSFRPLVEINMLDHDTQASSGHRVIKIVTDVFPARDDAISLKQDLVDGVLVARVQAELIRLVVLHERDGIAIFPSPTATGIARLAHLWPNQPDEILQLAEMTADADTPISKLVFANVLDIVQTQEFWPLACFYPRVRKHMVRIQPELLTNSTVTLDDTTLIDLLPLVPAKTKGLNSFIAELMLRDNVMLVNLTFDFFPDMAAVQVVSAANDRKIGMESVWLRELILRPKILLKSDVMSLISSSSLLYEFANALGWLSTEVISAGISPWRTAILTRVNDLRKDKAETLSCFLVSLAFTSGGDDGLHIVEKYYDNLHEKILKSELSLCAREILFPLLPDIGWAWNWDLGLRFRLAVAKAYIDNKWAPDSYAALAKDKKERMMLASAASNIQGGYAYVKAVSKNI